MKKQTDILVVGGGPAGVVAAITAKKNHPDKRVTLLRKEEKAVIPCGIPYIFRRLDSVDKNIMSDQPLLDSKVDLAIGQAVKIDPAEKTVHLADKEEYAYEKLILALGSKSQPIPISGIDKPGVWSVVKDYEYLKKMRQSVLDAKKVAIIGGGFIGVEFAEELSGIEGLQVCIIEREEYCLKTNFDREFSLAAEEKLKQAGVKIYVGRSVEEIVGEVKVEFLKLDNGEKLEADAVIVSVGACPNVELAKESGLKISESGAILTDEYLKTSQSDVFAVGDCVQSKDFITNKDISVMLASIAANEARIAANNLYQLELIKENKGTVGVFSTCIGGLSLAVAGLTEEKAEEQKIEYIVGQAETFNRHPAALPGAEKIKVKLIFSKSCENLLLGGEIMGAECVGEMINILALAVQKKVSLFDFNTWQIATHPLLTAAPTVYPLIAAAQSALLKINSSH